MNGLIGVRKMKIIKVSKKELDELSDKFYEKLCEKNIDLTWIKKKDDENG